MGYTILIVVEEIVVENGVRYRLVLSSKHLYFYS